MPVVDGTLVPNVPLTAAEQAVDFPALNQMILDQRARVERLAIPALRRLVYSLTEYHELGFAETDALARKLGLLLEHTARFGYREAQREVRALRAAGKVTAAVPILRHDIAAELAALGLHTVAQVVKARAARAAEAVALAARAKAAEQSDDEVIRRILIAETAAKTLHNQVLELVGVTLNLGRTAGAMRMAQPPEFALRSEQLDKATCDRCSRLHGSIAQVGSDEFFRLTPPAECFGGGRCRGVWVFGDTPLDMQMPEAA